MKKDLEKSGNFIEQMVYEPCRNFLVCLLVFNLLQSMEVDDCQPGSSGSQNGHGSKSEESQEEGDSQEETDSQDEGGVKKKKGKRKSKGAAQENGKIQRSILQLPGLKLHFPKVCRENVKLWNFLLYSEAVHFKIINKLFY